MYTHNRGLDGNHYKADILTDLSMMWYFGVVGYCGPFLHCCDYKLGEEDVWLLLYFYCNMTIMICEEERNTEVIFPGGAGEDTFSTSTGRSVFTG